MKKANTRLLVSLAALVMAIAIATTTTYAWFSMNTTTNVENIDLTVTTQDGIYVSLEAATGFKKTITGAELLAKVPATNVKLQALTAKAGTDNKIALVDDNGLGAKVGSYYQYTLYFRSASPYALVLSALPTATGKHPTAPVDNGALAAFKATTKKDMGAGALDAWFTDAADTAKFKDTTVANAIRYGFSSDNFATAANTKIFDPNATAGFSPLGNGTAGGTYADLNAAHAYYRYVNGAAPATLAETVKPATEVNTYAAAVLEKCVATDFFEDTVTPRVAMYTRTGTSDADYVYTYVAAPVVASVDTYYKLPAAVCYSGADTDTVATGTKTIVPANGAVTTVGGVRFFTGTSNLLVLTQVGGTGNYTGTLTVRIWAEGTDADCFDAILGDVLSTAVNFKGILMA